MNKIPQKERCEKQIFWNEATPDDFINADILDWIEGVGDISTHYEKRFVNVFGEVMKQRGIK